MVLCKICGHQRLSVVIDADAYGQPIWRTLRCAVCPGGAGGPSSKGGASRKGGSTSKDGTSRKGSRACKTSASRKGGFFRKATSPRKAGWAAELAVKAGVFHPDGSLVFYPLGCGSAGSAS